MEEIANVLYKKEQQTIDVIQAIKDNIEIDMQINGCFDNLDCILYEIKDKLQRYGYDFKFHISKI